MSGYIQHGKQREAEQHQPVQRKQEVLATELFPALYLGNKQKIPFLVICELSSLQLRS